MILLSTLSIDWAGYMPAQKIFYGIGCLAAFLILILGVFALIGVESHVDFEHPAFEGASLFTVKPIIGFFFGLGWAGGFCLGQMALLPALILALLAGTCSMVIIWGIIYTFMRFQNDGSMKIESAIGKDGVVYKTIDPEKGGIIQVNLNTGLETLTAVTRSKKPISTGQTVTVIQIEGPNLLVEVKKT